MYVVNLIIIFFITISCVSEVDVSLVSDTKNSFSTGQLSISNDKLTLNLIETKNNDISNAYFEYEGTSYKLSVEKTSENEYKFSPLVSINIKTSKKFIFKYKNQGKWFLIEKKPSLPEEISLDSFSGTTGNKRAYSDAIKTSWNDIFIRETTTINIPADYPSLIEALDYLNSKRIATNGFVTLLIADGTYNYTESVVFNHIDGNRIRIEGNVSNPENVVFNFVGVSGFTTSSGGNLNLRGLSIIGDDTGATKGIQVGSKSAMYVSDLIIEGFRTGVSAPSNSVIRGARLDVQDNVIGASILTGSTVHVTDSNYSNNSDDGIFVGTGSVASVDRSSINNNGGQGIEGWVNGYATNWGGSASGNSGDYAPGRNSNIQN